MGRRQRSIARKGRKTPRTTATTFNKHLPYDDREEEETGVVPGFRRQQLTNTEGSWFSEGEGDAQRSITYGRARK